MARLQVNIDAETSEILNGFNRPGQKRLFIEYAIKAAAQHPEVCEVFGLKDKAQVSVTAKAKPQSMNNWVEIKKEDIPSRVKFDDEFNDE